MNRRKFLNRSLAGTAGMSLLPSVISACSAVNDPLHDFGLISNVVQNLMKEDHRDTMTRLAAMGYKYLEFGGTYDESPSELKAFMAEIGLKPLAGGTSLPGLKGDGLKQSIDACLEMEKAYMVCYWPWVNWEESPAMDELKMVIEALQHIGLRCKENGLRFAFHNHFQEFFEINGKLIYDYLLEETDPDLVCMEVDLYWAHKGGRDIREYFKKYPGRFELVHVKDSYESESMQSFACAGSGILDFPDLFSYRDVAGFKHLIVEHDRPGPENELECARSSINYLKSLDF